MKSSYQFSASHPTEKYQSIARTIGVSHEISTDTYYATHPSLGCGHSRSTPEQAITDILLSNGFIGVGNIRKQQPHPEPQYNDPRTAFDQAIIDGRLSEIKTAFNYAGDYMYMGRIDGRDLFKNSNTRKYIA